MRKPQNNVLGNALDFNKKYNNRAHQELVKKKLDLGDLNSITELIIHQLGELKDITLFLNTGVATVLLNYFEEGHLVSRSESLRDAHAQKFPLLAEFTSQIKKIKTIKRNPKFALRIAGYEIPVNLFEFLKRQLDKTTTLLIYILLGYFSQDQQELLERLITYLKFIVEYSECEVESAGEWINHETEKGDGWMEPEESIKKYTHEAIGRVSCRIQIYPDRLEEAYTNYGHFNYKINFPHIIADLGHLSTGFKDFMHRYFALESIILFKREILNRCEDDKKIIEEIKKERFIGLFEVLDEEEKKAWKKVFPDEYEDFNPYRIAKWRADYLKECVEMDVYGRVITLRPFRGSIYDRKLKLLDLLHHFTHLEVLNLNDERSLKEVPKSIKELHNLKVLRIAQTGIETLPSFMSDMKSLKRLDLGTRFLGEPERRKKFLEPIRNKEIEIHIYATLEIPVMKFTMDDIYNKK